MKSTTKTKSNETATTTPNLNPAAQSTVDNYFGKVNSLLGQDPSSIITPTNQLQYGAMTGAAGLNGSAFDNAGAAINNVGPSALPTAYAPQTAAGPDTGFLLDRLGALPEASSVDTGFLSGVQGSGAGGSRAAQFLEDYRSPAEQQLVDATLGNYDHNAAQQRAQAARTAALNKSFGGSGAAIAEAELLGNQGRQRALTEAELRDNAWTRMIQAASGDADRSTNASIASMQSQNSLLGQLAGFRTQAALADAAAKNDLAMAGYTGGLDIAKLLYGTDADLSKFNAGEMNDILSQVYSTTAQNNQFNSNLALDKANSLLDYASSANADQRANIGLQQQIGDADWSRTNAGTLAPYTQLQLVNDAMTGGGLLGTTTGQTINTNGTSTSKQSGNLLGALLAAGAQVGSAFAGK